MADSGSVGNTFGAKFEQEYRDMKRSIAKPAILVMGATGAGKSSLVNLVFGPDTAKVGAGKPVTSKINRYQSELITIFDSEGYESGDAKQAQFKERVVGFIEKESLDLGERVHLVWYCISQANHRILDIDIQTVNAISALNVPIAVVLTQADSVSAEDSEKLISIVKESCKGVAIFEASTDAKVGLSIEPLTEWAYENLDSGLRTAFVSATKGQLQLKKRAALIAVAPFVAAAGAIGASPIPLSDAPLLVANQAAMVARIAFIWDLPGIKSVAAGGVASQLVTQLARSLVGNLLKLFPVAGSAAGAAINASVASTFTAAIGYAVNEICFRITSDDLNGVKMDMADYFGGEMVTSLIAEYMSSAGKR